MTHNIIVYEINDAGQLVARKMTVEEYDFEFMQTPPAEEAPTE